MNKELNRRQFIKHVAVARMGVGLLNTFLMSSVYAKTTLKNVWIGIIGLDTSHSIAFTKSLNSATGNKAFGGFKIPGYIEDVKKLGVEICIAELKKINVNFVSGTYPLKKNHIFIAKINCN